MSSIRVSVGLFAVENFYGGDLLSLVKVSQLAEAVGIDQIVLTDHVVMGARVDRYPYGDFPVPPATPWLEPMLTMATIAGATKKIRLSTSIVIAPLRPAVLLAKQAASLDALSNRENCTSLSIQSADCSRR